MHAKSSLRVVLMQLDHGSAAAPEARLAEIAARVAGLRDADLVVLPELWATGYFCFEDYPAHARPLGGQIAERLGQAARRAGAVVVAGTFLEAGDDGRIHNTALVFDSDGALALAQRKLHVFGVGSREAELVAPGEEVAVAATAAGRIGVAVCYDLRFPELFRLHADDGAEMIVLPAAWPAARLEHWRLLLRARAVENQAYVLGCNGAGSDHGTPLAGHSAIIDPLGDVLAEAGDAPGEVRAQIDVASVGHTRAAFPALADRRFAVLHPEGALA